MALYGEREGGRSEIGTMSGGEGEGESKEGMCPWLTEVPGHRGRQLTIWGVIFFRKKTSLETMPTRNNYLGIVYPAP